MEEWVGENQEEEEKRGGEGEEEEEEEVVESEEVGGVKREVGEEEMEELRYGQAVPKVFNPLYHNLHRQIRTKKIEVALETNSKHAMSLKF